MKNQYFRRMKKIFTTRLATLFIAVLGYGTLYAQVPTGYYDSADGLDGENLKTALNNIIKGHTKFSYSAVWDILQETDKDPNNPNNVILIYTGESVNGPQTYNNGSGWNREHVWAKSRGNFGTAQGPGTDVHHLRPSNISVNSARGNRWFGNATTPHMLNGTPTGNYFDNNEHLWQPRDEVKGDVARMIFYMATRYEGQNGELDLEVVDYLPSSNTSSPIHARLTDLLEWHNEDPVDDWERNRNDVIYYNYQNNRNPFIDHPEFVALIWGEEDTTSTATLNFEELNQTKELLKVIDMTGREVKPKPNTLLIYIYSDGTREKRVYSH